MKNITSNKKKINLPSFQIYKGKPLVRCNDVIYYGKASERYVVKIEVKDSSLMSDLKISSKVSVEMIDTNPEIEGTKKIVKISEKNGLYPALDIANVWLSRINNEN